MEGVLAKAFSEFAHAPAETVAALELVLKMVTVASIVEWLMTHPIFTIGGALVVGAVWASASKTTGNVPSDASRPAAAELTPVPAKSDTQNP